MKTLDLIWVCLFSLIMGSVFLYITLSGTTLFNTLRALITLLVWIYPVFRLFKFDKVRR